MDSDHRSRRQQIYSLPPLAARELSQNAIILYKLSKRLYIIKIEAGGRNRTPDLLITNQLLYQLSYTSLSQQIVLYHIEIYLSIDILLFFAIISNKFLLK